MNTRQIEIATVCELSAHMVAPLFSLFGWKWESEEHKGKHVGVHEIHYEFWKQLRWASESKIDGRVSSGRLAVIREPSDEPNQHDYHLVLELGSVMGVTQQEMERALR